MSTVPVVESTPFGPVQGDNLKGLLLFLYLALC